MNSHIQAWFERFGGQVTQLSDDMFNHPETAMEEYYACRQTADFMRAHGFEVQEVDVKNQGGRPNCVVATFGSGKPVIGYLGELDALAGLGQQAEPRHAPLPGPGHGCGHHLLGAGSAAAAAALAAAMRAGGLAGTVIYYGCPAEETIEGKIYMIRDGWFDPLDVCLSWHPGGGAPRVSENSMQANTNMDFAFFGKTAHAAADPQNGRSALDAAELLSVGVQYLREHVTDDVRIHHVYVNGGEKPNIVPDYARVNYYIRAATRSTDDQVVERVKRIAQGAALMTDTRMEFYLNTAVYETFIVHSLNRFLHAAASKVPLPQYTEAEQAFAAALYEAHAGAPHTGGPLLPQRLEPLTGVVSPASGSTDVSDVSHLVPTAQISGPGFVAGLPGHHWTVTAASGSSIGHKAELFVGQALAQCGADILADPAVLESFWGEFREARKDMAPYRCPLAPEAE